MYIHVHILSTLTANLELVAVGEGFSRNDTMRPFPSTSTMPSLVVSIDKGPCQNGGGGMSVSVLVVE